MSLIKYVVKHTDLVEYSGQYSAFQESVYIARGVDARIAELERLLDVERRAVETASKCAAVALKWEAQTKKLCARVDELEKALQIADKNFCYPDCGPAIDDSCPCIYCQYARARSVL